MNDNKTTDLACEELVEIITDYLEGTLPATDRVRFEAHIQTCPGCREYVEQMRTTIRVTGYLDVESLSPRARDQLLRTFRRWKESSSRA
jgi:anti-sigma factor RsiW